MKENIKQFLDEKKYAIKNYAADLPFTLEISEKLFADIQLGDLSAIINDVIVPDNKENTAFANFSYEIILHFPNTLPPDQQLLLFQELLELSNFTANTTLHIKNVRLNENILKKFQILFEENKINNKLKELKIESGNNRKGDFQNAEETLDALQEILEKLKQKDNPFLQNLIYIEMVNVLIGEGDFLLAYQFAEKIIDKYIKRLFQAEIINLDNTLVDSGLLSQKEKIATITYLTASAKPDTLDNRNVLLRDNLLKNYFEAFQSNKDIVRPSSQSFFEKTGYELAVSAVDFGAFLISHNIALPAKFTFKWFLEQLNIPSIQEACKKYFGTDKLVPLEILMHLPMINNDTENDILIKRENEQLTIENNLLPKIAGFYLTDESKQELDHIASHPLPQKTFDSESAYVGTRIAADKLNIPEACERLVQFYQAIGEENLKSEYQKAAIYCHGFYLSEKGIRLVKENNAVALQGLKDSSDSNYENTLFLALLYQVGTAPQANTKYLYDLTNNQIERDEKLSLYYFQKILATDYWKKALIAMMQHSPKPINKNIANYTAKYIEQYIQYTPFLLLALKTIDSKNSEVQPSNSPVTIDDFKLYVYAELTMSEACGTASAHPYADQFKKLVLSSSPSHLKKVMTALCCYVQDGFINDKYIYQVFFDIFRHVLVNQFTQWISKNDKANSLSDFFNQQEKTISAMFCFSLHATSNLFNEDTLQSIFSGCETDDQKYALFLLIKSKIKDFSQLKLLYIAAGKALANCSDSSLLCQDPAILLNLYYFRSDEKNHYLAMISQLTDFSVIHQMFRNDLNFVKQIMIITDYLIEYKKLNSKFFEQVFLWPDWFLNKNVQEYFIKNIFFFADHIDHDILLKAVHLIPTRDSAIAYYYILSSSKNDTVKTVANRRLQVLTENKPNEAWKEFESLWNKDEALSLVEKTIFLFEHYDRQFGPTLFISNIVSKFSTQPRQFSDVVKQIIDTLDCCRGWEKDSILNYFSSEVFLKKIANANLNGRMMNMIKFIEAKCMGVETNLQLENMASKKQAN